MAETPITPINAEERQKRIDEKTSVGRYAVKEIQTIGLPIAGAMAGFFLGKGLLKNEKIAQWAENKMPWRENFGAQRVFSWISAAIGLQIAGIINTYEHWRNAESEKLAVNEINTDVGNLVEQRSKFAETLNHQEALIRQLIAEREKSGTFSDRTATTPAAADMGRSS